MTCPDANTLAAFAEGRLRAEERAELEAHLDRCGECSELVAELVVEQRDAASARDLEAQDADADEEATAIEEPGDAQPTDERAASGVREIAGDRLGRYLILELLGAGGMGRVYRAYDPELDRRVALKVLRRDLHGGTGGSSGGARLQREAQAQATLSHQNVVAIYDVGYAEGRIFIAMELVEGEELRTWQNLGRAQGTPRPWSEILAMYVQAGAGLAAAHEAGLLHRDFKPDNVIVGKDGIARVLDFGLAKPMREPEELERDFAVERARIPNLDDLTMTGAVLGTPAYMAPEQYRAEEVDVRADQFAFCVALWEAVFGARPFAGAKLKDLREAVLAGRVDDPPRDRRVPGWLERTLRRGLAAKPEDRYPTMQALLDELTRHPKRRRTLATVASLAAGFVLVAGLAYAQGRSVEGEEQGPPVCGGADERVEAVWSASRAEAIEAAFEASELGFAPASWTAVEAGVEDRLSRWTAGYVEACEATRVHAVASEAVLDTRMRCLDRRLAELDALLELLEEPDAARIEKAPKAVAGLSSIEACADVETLARVDPLPEDPKLRARIDAAFAELDRSKADAMVGRLEAGRERVREVREQAEALDYEPLLAATLLRLGDLDDRLGDPQGAEATLREALTVAEASGDERTAASAWATLIYVVGVELARVDDARWMAGVAAAKASRVEASDDLRRSLHANRAMLEYVAGEYDAALAELEQAIEIAGDDPITLPPLLDVLGSIHRQRGERDQAKAAFERAIAVASEALGPDHPLLASSYGNLGAVLHAQAEYEQAMVATKKALALFEATNPRSPHTAMALANVANIHSALGEHEQARELQARALDIKREVYGEEHPEIASSLDNLGGTLLALGRPKQALETHEQALEIRLAVQREDHPYLAYSLQGIGAAALELGDHERAVDALERALALRDREEGSDPIELGETQFSLARALVAAGRERDRALDLAEQARDNLEDSAEHLAKLDAWLAEHSESP